MKIPYSAIRFPKKEIQQWGINFFRITRRFREESYWNYVDPKIESMFFQAGILNGISNIVPPLRLSLIPYASAYAENYPYNIPDKSNTSFIFNGGMDLKYGINESFTFDMTMIPDF